MRKQDDFMKCRLFLASAVIGVLIVHIGGNAAPQELVDQNPHPDKAEGMAASVVNDEISRQPEVASGALSLEDCYRLALDRSETIAISEEEVRITEARFLRALSTVIPNISFISTDSREDDDRPRPTSSTSLFIYSESSERKFFAKQTLFNGFKTIAAVKGSRSERNQRIQDRLKAEQLLLVDVANSFYLLIEIQRDMASLEKIQDAYLERIKELRAREDLGRSRAGEVVNARAQLFKVIADIEVVQSQEAVARQMLEYLIGKAIVGLNDTLAMPSSLKSKESYVAKSMERPEIRASKFAWNLARQEVLVRGSDYLPSVDIETNHYMQRTGSQKGNDWDIKLKIDVPIFEGTDTLGQVKEAEARARQKKLEYQKLSRWAPYDIENAYVKLRTAINIQKALKDAYETSRLNYHLQKKDYDLNLVNNLDVLAAIQGLQDAQRNYIHAFYEAKRLYWQLKVAIGEGLAEGGYDAI